MVRPVRLPGSRHGTAAGPHPWRRWTEEGVRAAAGNAPRVGVQPASEPHRAPGPQGRPGRPRSAGRRTAAGGRLDVGRVIGSRWVNSFGEHLARGTRVRPCTLSPVRVRESHVGTDTTDVDGLIHQLTDPTDPTGNIASFNDYVAAFSGAIDGLWASMLSEIAIVANVDAYRLSARTFFGTGDALNAADYLRRNTGGWWTNKRMPATAATIARGIVHRMGRPGMRTASHPTWGAISIDDIYSDSASGQRHFSMHVLVGTKVLIVQPDAYGLVEFKVA